MNKTDGKTKFTPEQRAAIMHRGTSLLVSAAAGSGKTRVLVERLLNRIDEGAGIDDFLVITYTRAAALELKERISDGLYERQRQNKKKSHYRRQIILCSTAPIDTIHTFCGEVLRENAHLVGLPPDFRVIDENESEIIRREVLSDVLDFAYEGISDGLSDLLSMVIDGRDDRTLEEIVLDLSRRLRSLPSPQEWIKKQIKSLTEIHTKALNETDCGKYMTDELKELVSYCGNQMNILREEMTVNTEFKEKYGKSIEVSYRGIKKLEDSLTINWDEGCKSKNIDFPTVGRLSGYNELKTIRSWCRDELRKSTKVLENSSSEHMEDLRQIAPAMIALLSLVENFDEAYSVEKKKRGTADFSDMEHLTLSLLIDKESGKKTQIASSLSKRFTEIMVDEYQDVNEVQEMIFKAISKNESNIFMVGDVKQSIYRFRLADPGIFLSKYDSFIEADIQDGAQAGAPGAQTGAQTEAQAGISASSSSKTMSTGVKIHLSKNFRSHRGILETVNHVFANIMSPKLGEMQYSRHEMLVPGRNSEMSIETKQGKQGIQGKQGAQEIAVEFDFISTKSKSSETLDDGDLESMKALDLEARHIANRIVELFESDYKVPEEDGTLRALRPSDIVILARSQKGVAGRIATALRNADIPTDCTSSEEFFETREISAIMSLLSVIDNPMQDIELAAVLSGPIYKFSSDELAMIKAHNSMNSYYDAIKRAAERNAESGDIHCKCRRFVEDIETFRTVAADMTADRLIWYIYNKTELTGIVSSMSGGNRRKENLIMLTELAAGIEQNGYKGLFGFLTYIRKLKSRGFDRPSATPAGATAAVNLNAVTIMTIHKSKGLEFPVVFLANTSRRHNNLESQKPIVFHKELGIGSLRIDRERRIKYSTLQRTAILSKLKAEMLSEELRVLYVAMTRACEKLIVTGTYSDARSKADKLHQSIIGKPSPHELSRMSSISDWLLTGLKGIDENIARVNYIEPESIIVQKYIKLTPETEIVEQEAKSGTSKGTTKTAKRSTDIDYPYEASIKIPSKLTVTGLKYLADKEAETAPWAKMRRKESAAFTRPSFISKRRKKTSAELGILLHHVMQYIDYKMCSTEHETVKGLQYLVEADVIDESESHEVDAKRIVRLFNTDLGKRLSTAAEISREFKFSILIPAGDYTFKPEKREGSSYSDGCNCGAKVVEKCTCDKILLQGVIDCFFEEDGELVLVDFKTDKVTESTIDGRAAEYIPQLNTYASALERITGKKVKERIIYFFEMDRAYYLK